MVSQHFISEDRASTESTPCRQPLGLPRQLLIHKYDFLVTHLSRPRLLGCGRVTCERANELSTTTFRFPPAKSDGAKCGGRAGFDRLLTGMLIGVSGLRFTSQRPMMR